MGHDHNPPHRFTGCKDTPNPLQLQKYLKKSGEWHE